VEASLQDGRGQTLSGHVLLCRLDEIEDPGSRGFDDIEGEEPFFVVRRGEEAFAYRNSCPHYGAPLDWKPHAFLSVDKSRILCSMHGALFEIEDGACVLGPCPGDVLEKVEIEVAEDTIFLI
jgi:nitrite reductase/ring-hydroxylating ferredoxin subunit